MQRFFFTILFSLLALSAFPADPETQLKAADEAFIEQSYTLALDAYEAVYAQGYYTEAMLYRLSYMHEMLKNYPDAIFYLKKAAKEYGNPAVDAKVKQLMQLQGSDRFFPSSAWNTYLLFFKRWGFLLWTLFGLSIAAISVHLILPPRRFEQLRKGVATVAWTFIILLGAALFHRSFMVPELAVVTEPTAFYDMPAYASKATLKALSIGETVTLTDAQDIWFEVEAGDNRYWVPKSVIRKL